MGLTLLKKISILFLLISASLLSTSMAGRDSKFVSKSAVEVGATFEEKHDKEATIHERLLKMNTKDYAKYDPSPALVKPPFKLIPN